MRRRFKIAEHEEYGYVGLAPTWMAGEQSDPMMGMGVAHDILEHGSKDVCEWQGLGGSVYVRGVSGYFRSRIGNPDAAENIGSEWINLFNLWNGEAIPDPGRTRRVDTEAEELIQACVREGCKLVHSEVEDNERVVEWTSSEQRRRMVGWMRRGYRACVLRWKSYDCWTLAETFRAIESAVDTFCNHEAKEYEGAEAIVSFYVDSARATVDVDYRER